MENKSCFVIGLLLLAFSVEVNAQPGFRVEANIGPTIGDSRELFSYTLQGNLYYLWQVSMDIDVGLTSGAIVFLGDNSNTDDMYVGFSPDEYEPALYIPVAIGGRANLSKSFAIGLDAGYAFYIHVFDDGGGLYLRPVVTYKLNEKLSLVGSYVHIGEDGYSASAITIGLNLGF